MAPASLEALSQALCELYLSTARRAEDSTDRKTVVALYARELSGFPADLTLAAIRGYRGAFFPALNDLRGPIEGDRRLRERRLRIAALRAHFAESGWRAGPLKARVTPEQAAAIRARYGFEGPKTA